MRIFVVFGVLAVMLVLVTLELVRLRRLKERYAAIWVGFAVVVATGAFFPSAVIWMSDVLGFEVPANLVISGGIFALALVAIQLSVEVTRLRDKLERITSRLAVLEAEKTDVDSGHSTRSL